MYGSMSSTSTRRRRSPHRRQVTRPSPPLGNITPNKIWQSLLSIPHHLLCFSSPICSPCCGICCCVTCIRTAEYGVLQRFGKFDGILDPGMHVLKWPMERVAGRLSMRVRQLDLDCETKSADHVFLRVHVSVQYQVNSTHLFESFYSLTSPARQMTTHAHDVMRSTLPRMTLDDIFASQDSIAVELHESLNENMNEYGYMVNHALITRIQPNQRVRESMNEMQASKRMKEAMPHRAEAEKIQLVKAAEARAERAHLIGVGVSRERREIAKGMQNVMNGVLEEKCPGDQRGAASPKGVMDLLLLSQYFNVISDLNGHKRSEEEGEDSAFNSLLLAHMPKTVSQLTETASKCFGSIDGDVKVENILDL